MDDRFLGLLPAPFNQEHFRILRKGIYEHPEIDVYVAQEGDFACLHPQPPFNYTQYSPRFQRLNLSEYRKRNRVVERRYEKIRTHFTGMVSVLEIGSSDGAFLQYAREQNTALTLASLEVDASTQAVRDRSSWLKQYGSFSELHERQARFDLVCFFHVLEHIASPAAFLSSCTKVLKPKGKVVIEVPSLDDPLRTLYRVEEYENFYFQAQHPYVYSARSLRRLLEHNGFRVLSCFGHQRYGLENHLTWLAQRRPGGNEALREMFAHLDEHYRERLESTGHSDAVIAIAEAVRG
jgi:2-polyprenyl-3-methyl-5-hydroxy-6-metoxy-1,4-benzoquinol methylase